jgi:curli biogenesis system outer membrane secretion channel CsgG
MMRYRHAIAGGFAIALSCACIVGASAGSGDQAPVAPPKKTIAVGTFESPEMLAGGATGEGLAAMLTDALVHDGHFVVIERQAVAQVQSEQALTQSGAVTGEAAAASGKMTGASVLILGTVTKYNPQANSNSFGVGGFGGMLGSDENSTVGYSGQTAEVEINLRLIDTTTGQVLFSGAAKGTASAKGVSADIYNSSGMHFGGQQFSSTPLGKAAQDAMQSAVTQIDAWMDKVPWSALVIENDNGTVYINAGANQNMREGMMLHVYRAAKPLVDPATGQVIDVLTSNVGTIQIQSVRDRTAICTIASGDQPARGDLLKLN